MIPKLRMALADYDRTRPIIDGRVPIAGYQFEIACLDHEDMFVRAFATAEFDVTELSFGRYVMNAALGKSAYVALPIFPSRAFRHSAFYVRTDRGIRAPADLAGRTVGVRNYANTASLIARGMLEDEYGVRARDMKWLVGDVDHAERAAIDVPELPQGFDVRPLASGRLLSDMLAAGDIDGLVDYQPPACFMARHAGVGRLFPDHVAAERAYFARTGIFPIMHVLAIRRDVLERDGTIARSLYDAFDWARALAIADLWSPGALKISLPWIGEEYQRTVELMGRDLWSYGVAVNRAAIDSVPRYCHAQGLAPRLLAMDELFSPAMLET